MVYPTLRFEEKLWSEGKKYIVGIDEVGRGCFAGPVVVGAVMFSSESQIPEGIADSKLLKPQKREELDKLIRESAVSFAIAEVSVEVINDLGIGKATQQAFREVLEKLDTTPDQILIDAFFIEGIDKTIQKPIIGGDRVCISIAAASIIAKVYRDRLMDELDKDYPQYGLKKNKGYGTKAHRDAIKKYGLSKLHRTSFNLDKFLS
jgi:ribonuclease HII